MRLAAALALLLAAPAAMAATIHVPGDQPTIQAAVDAAAPADTVLLAAGTFSGLGNVNVFISKDLSLLSESGAQTTVIDCESATRGLLIANATVLVDDLTIRRGNSAGGGAMFSLGASLTISNCTFDSNEGEGELAGGGAVGCQTSSVLIDGCTFSSNYVLGVGGGVATAYCPTVMVTNSIFEDNSTDEDGQAAAFSAFQCDAVFIQGCTFDRNSARSDAAMLIFGTLGTEVTIDDSSFSENHASGPTGALAVEGSLLNLSDCEFDSNHAGTLAGALFLSQCTGEISRCLFSRNTASTRYGAVSGGGVAVRDCVFSENAAATYAALSTNRDVESCIFWANEATVGPIVGLGTSDNINVRRCTFFENHVLLGSIIRFRGSHSSTATLAETILAYNVGVPVSCEDFNGDFLDLLTTECSDVWNNTGGDWVGCLEEFEGIEGNFSADPLFCDPNNGDLTLSSQSPCLPGNHPDGVDCGLIGALGEGCGPVSVEQESWAGIKSRYR